MPKLGFGTFRLTGRECFDAVHDALDAGYRHIDTAQMYANEAEVGRAIEASDVARDDVFLTTKVWHDSLRHDDVHRTVRASLEALRTARVDLLLVHWLNRDVPLDETLRAFRELLDAGAARRIGVSNFPPTMLRRALDLAPIACDQVEYHPFLGQDELLALGRERGVAVTAYCPLARGLVPESAVLRRIGEACGKSPAQVALRWLIQQPGVAAIPKAASPEHRRANLNVFDFELDDAQMRAVAAEDAGRRLIDPEFAPDWGR